MLQSCWRKYFCQLKWRFLKKRLLKLQSRVRTWLAMRRYCKAMQSAVLLQSVLRKHRVRLTFLTIKKAAVAIQSTFRMSVLRTFFVQYIRPSGALLGITTDTDHLFLILDVYVIYVCTVYVCCIYVCTVCMYYSCMYISIFECMYLCT